MRVYVVRHGQTEWNAAERAQGHTDIPLDEDGLRQARALGAAFSSIKLSAVYASDLCRSIETARPISEAAGVQLIAVPDLRERSFGEWEGRAFSFIRESTPTAAGDDFAPPQGESLQCVWDRIARWADALRQTDDAVAIVGHGGSSAMLLSHLLRGTLETSRSFRFANASISEVERRHDGRFALVRYNDVSHLSRPALSGDLDGSHR